MAAPIHKEKFVSKGCSTSASRLYIKKVATTLRNNLPPVNKRTGKLDTPLNQTVWPTFTKRCPNPTCNVISSFDKLDPLEFQHWDCEIVFWAPHIFFGDKPPCPCCNSDKKLRCKDWDGKLRRVFGSERTYYISSYRYKCVGCTGKYIAKCK